MTSHFETIRSVPDARIYEPQLDGRLQTENRRYLERVLRLKTGDVFCITDGSGREGVVQLEANGGYSALRVTEPSREAHLNVTLFAALTKGDRFEWLIEKAVELGVARLIPLVCERSVVRDLSAAKLERYRKIVLAAMLQSGGCRLPELAEPLKMSDLPEVKEGISGWILHEATAIHRPLLPPLAPDTAAVWLCSGPEGGFSETEVAGLKARGWRGVSLGPRRLRAETAPLAALAALLLRDA